ncbi:MAG: hypothetical protein AMXMBFR42_30100 [Burkholderiales bacterium]
MELLRVDEVLDRLRVSKACLYRMIRAGRAPGPIKVSAKRSAWLASEIDRYVAGRVAARDSTPRRAA